MSLISSAELRDYYNVPGDFPDGPIEEAILIASSSIKQFVGSTIYTDAGAATPTDADRATILKLAEGRVAVYRLLLNNGSQLRRGGIVRKEQDAAGPLAGTVINEYASADELRKLRDQYLEDALGMLSAYWDPDVGVNVFDAGGITVGTIRPADLEPDCYAGTMLDEVAV